MTATSELTRVTPEVAIQWGQLTQPGLNRPLRQSHVDFLARQMASGKWRVTGDTCISFVGHLNNQTAALLGGRHILAAVAQSGTSIDVFVAEGCDLDASLIANSGRPIVLHEFLIQHRKAQNAVKQAAVTRLAFMASNGRVPELLTGGGRYRPTNEEMLTFYDAHPGISDAARDGFGIATQLPKNASGTAIGTAMLRLTEIDPMVADEFFRRVANGQIEGLRRFFNQNSELDPPRRASHQLAAIYKTWNAERTGARLHRNTSKWIPTTEPWPEPA